jgi:hypothetical protein
VKLINVLPLVTNPDATPIFYCSNSLDLLFIVTGKAVSPDGGGTQIDLKLQSRLKKLILTTKRALVNRMIIVSV